MDAPPNTKAKQFRVKRSRFEQTVLLLQGGGALGSYQAGVYQALAEADLHPDWVAGISIGAVNAALIAGNPPEKRIEKLREFWEAVSTPPLGVPYLASIDIKDDAFHRFVNQTRALGIMMFGAPHFFKPRLLSPVFWPSPNADQLSFYDVAPLRATLERLVDFDLLNAGAMRFSVGAVNVKTANFVYFDSTTHRIGPEHIIASGSLPPGFPATEIEGEYYWDGGLVSNTPLQWVVDYGPRQDTLAFQVDLWSARGELPRNLAEVATRQKEIQFSSRTRANTDQSKRMQQIRWALAKLLPKLPDNLRDNEEAKILNAAACHKVYSIVHLIYRAKNYEGHSKDYEFSRVSMQDHWRAGYHDAVRTLRHPDVLARPTNLDGVFTFDLARDGRE